MFDSRDAKKLCKKVKASPSSGKYVMKHYHNGDYNKDYDRAVKVSAIVNFLNDPKGDLPWVSWCLTIFHDLMLTYCFFVTAG